jgi:hypothetical protein
MLLFTALAHFDAFGMRADLVAVVPSALPAPGLLLTLTGILELAGVLGIRRVSVTSSALHRIPRTGKMAKAPKSALAPATV